MMRRARRARWAARAMVVPVTTAALACAPPPDGGDEAAEAGPPAAAAEADPWYRRARTLDLTGDGRADEVRLEARGTRPDSLDVVLTLVVDGRAAHREAWGSGYELALEDASVRAGAAAGEVLRARLDAVLASVTLRRLDDPSVRLMAEDGPALAGLEPRPSHLVSFAYGYETTVRLAWDAPRARFVRLWSCC
jgi:hypothetical protein